MNLATGSSELSAEDNIAAGSTFQSVMMSGKKLYKVSTTFTSRRSEIGHVLDAGFHYLKSYIQRK